MYKIKMALSALARFGILILKELKTTITKVLPKKMILYVYNYMHT